MFTLISHVIVSVITLLLLAQLPTIVADGALPPSDSGKPQPTSRTASSGVSAWLEEFAERAAALMWPTKTAEPLHIEDVQQTLRKLERHAAVPRPNEPSNSAAAVFRADVTDAARQRQSADLKDADSHAKRNDALAAMMSRFMVANIDADNAEALRDDCGMTDEDAAASAVAMNKNI